MNVEIMKTMGFGESILNLKESICPFCNKKVNIDSFTDKLSLKEFNISGICQKCQNTFFE